MANKKKRKAVTPWWRRRKPLRRLAIAAAAAAVIAGFAWLALKPGGDGGPKEYLREPAPPFTLPTIAGEQVSLAGHLGEHALLLYFNEGMG